MAQKARWAHCPRNARKAQGVGCTGCCGASSLVSTTYCNNMTLHRLMTKRHCIATMRIQSLQMGCRYTPCGCLVVCPYCTRRTQQHAPPSPSYTLPHTKPLSHTPHPYTHSVAAIGSQKHSKTLCLYIIYNSFPPDTPHGPLPRPKGPPLEQQRKGGPP